MFFARRIGQPVRVHAQRDRWVLVPELLVTADEVGDLAAGLPIQTRVNGTVVQDGNTRDMIFGVGDLLSRINHTLTLNPGDVVVTGTPEGVGYVRTPPWYLQPGDVVEVEVERLGIVRTPIVGSEERP